MTRIGAGRRNRRWMAMACAPMMLASGGGERVAAAANTAQPDVFIGTLAKEGRDLVLTRCDLARTRYILVDAPRSAAVAQVRDRALPAYGEVIGRYGERRGHPILRVDHIDQVTPGRDCHLDTALDRFARHYDPAVPPSAGRADADLTGHYYLSHVMETGSELLLNADGTFAWSLSYGAVDQSAEGRWHKDGAAVILTARTPARDRPLFAYVSTEPWSAQAEREAVQRTYETTAAGIRDACPFLTDTWVATAPLASFDEVRPKLSAAVLHQQAVAALTKAVAARLQVEALARRMMAGTPPPAGSEAADRVHRMLSDWLDAKDGARQAARAAGLPDPDLADPVLPAACSIPPMKDVADDAPAGWTGGLGVRVSDRDDQHGARGVEILLRFADGHEEKLVTGGNGLAILPGKSATAAVGATLRIPYATGRDASFTVPPVVHGIVHFTLDAQQLAVPPFASLRLTISGKSLVLPAGRGRYERQP